LRLTLSIDESGLQELADLAPDIVRIRDIEIRRGKIRCEDFSIVHPKSPIWHWTVWVKPVHTSLRSIRLEMGVGKIGGIGKLVRVVYDRLKGYLPALPVNVVGKGLEFDTDPIKVLRVEAEDHKLIIEVTI